MALPFEHCPTFPNVFVDIDTAKEYSGLYTPCRVDPTTVKSGYVYECRHGDTNVSKIVTIEPKVVVNFKGTFICNEPIVFSNEEDKYINVERRWM